MLVRIVDVLWNILPMQENDSQNPRNVLPDLIIPILALSFAIYYLTTITEVPWIAQASAILVSCLLLASILAFAIRTYHRIRDGREFISFDGLITDYHLLLKRLALLSLSIAYIWFLESLGFTVSTMVFLFLAIVLLSSFANWRKAAIISISCSLVGYIVFIVIFETRFPKGHFERLIQETLLGS